MKKLLWLLALIAVFSACNNKDPKNNTEQPGNAPQDTVSGRKADTPATPPPAPRADISYTGMKMKGVDSNYKYIISTYTGDSLEIILQLNRIDKRYLRSVDTLIIPDKITGNLMDYTPYPASLPLLKDVDKLFIFSYPVQAFAVYEKGRLIRWGATSMGKKASKTPQGVHFTNWKGRKITSSVNSSWILEYNFNIMNSMGVGWHQYELPGYPASHSCLRLFMHDAEWLYTYADQWILKNGQLTAKGNPVLVYGEYPWGQRRPWYQLMDDPHANDIRAEELNELLQPELENILKEQENRKATLNPEPAAVTDSTTQAVP